eukprot:gb/GECG01008981.1/.p1 GENE.gb/GECG01008981.1/~~gb/GECG01008981.1/.p1  ORF type:complete len:376 (+),score=22.85 gb/GECG01008981.1/:1-1128(+)
MRRVTQGLAVGSLLQRGCPFQIPERVRLMSSEASYLPGLFAHADTTLQNGTAVRGQPMHRSHNKIAIVGGAGSVGLACAYALLNQGIGSELHLIDTDAARIEGEVMDLQHGSAFCRQTSIRGGTDYSLCEDADLVLITAGARQRPGETRLDLVDRNVEIFKGIVPEVVFQAPNSTVMVISNPCDIMTWVAWKLSGFHANRVLGPGTALDTSRFRTLIAERLQIASSSVHGYILGEHGETSVAAWSQLTVGGVPLQHLNPNMGNERDREQWRAVYEDVVSAGEKLINRKGYTNWAIGLTVSFIANAILRNERKIIPVSTMAKGLYTIDEEVFLSVPSVLGAHGVAEVVRMPLSERELSQMRHSASVLAETQRCLKI